MSQIVENDSSEYLDLLNVIISAIERDQGERNTLRIGERFEDCWQYEGFHVFCEDILNRTEEYETENGVSLRIGELFADCWEDEGFLDFSENILNRTEEDETKNKVTVTLRIGELFADCWEDEGFLAFCENILHRAEEEETLDAANA
ncbi:unnamed protein product [Cyprideis torosa]|uniref:Uncharacterized protein n=1 Tax=Cyprideis torosa TaxID=163714 RepID=A0A7R8ZTH4_9CRUS|nr:unnamed protein product [Cyprideis torosa]CAG0898023.1 unnamed protein product [Cyprideis torosa]